MIPCDLQTELKMSTDTIPKHVAIIMDGNRRWAVKRLMNPSIGHQEGATVVEKIVRRAIDLNISILTLFAFSTENWKRSKTEVEILFSIFYAHLKQMRSYMIKQGVRLQTIGDLNPLPEDLKKLINTIKKETEKNQKLELVLAINYGARDEMARAVKNIAKAVEEGLIESSCIDEKLLESYLDTYRFSDPDLVIRTSGEKRLSNFLLWQAAYAEFYTTDTLWPDFDEEELNKAVSEYSKRQRRRGA